MAEHSIPVDLKNPGQVFACLGFVEAAAILLGDARGGFDWSDQNEARFRLAAQSDKNPFERVLQFIDEAEVESVAPEQSANSTEKWQVKTVKDTTGTFPFSDPNTPATLPARLKDKDGDATIVIDYWGEQTRQTGRDNVKFWAGSGGYPGVALARDVLDLTRGKVMDYAHDPFSLSAPQKSSFRLDWRRDYVPIETGFSPNDHGHITMQGYPLVELLAAIGLAHARPKWKEKLKYTYGVAGIFKEQLYDPVFLRPALGAERALFPNMPFRLFKMNLDWPGQEGQARCITHVIEETINHD